MPAARQQRPKMSAEVWVPHVKLCKKRANAKWYVKKKVCILQKKDVRLQKKKAKASLYVWSKSEFLAHRNALHYQVWGYPWCREEPMEYCVRCDLIEQDPQWLEEGILKWCVRNFCFRERHNSQHWVMHRAGVGCVFCEMLISGELDEK